MHTSWSQGITDWRKEVEGKTHDKQPCLKWDSRWCVIKEIQVKQNKTKRYKRSIPHRSWPGLLLQHHLLLLTPWIYTSNGQPYWTLYRTLNNILPFRTFFLHLSFLDNACIFFRTKPQWHSPTLPRNRIVYLFLLDFCLTGETKCLLKACLPPFFKVSAYWSF